ncbi:MAG: hypothetical protein FWB94_00375 [Chitinispirillia bacterium]|nr:hypothetical protein [Chitinispirillia bacterium]
MLDNYYNLNAKERFDALFGGLHAAKSPLQVLLIQRPHLRQRLGLKRVFEVQLREPFRRKLPATQQFRPRLPYRFFLKIRVLPLEPFVVRLVCRHDLRPVRPFCQGE